MSKDKQGADFLEKYSNCEVIIVWLHLILRCSGFVLHYNLFIEVVLNYVFVTSFIGRPG